MKNAVTHSNICLDELRFSLLLQPLLHESSRHRSKWISKEFVTNKISICLPIRYNMMHFTLHFNAFQRVICTKLSHNLMQVAKAVDAK